MHRGWMFFWMVLGILLFVAARLYAVGLRGDLSWGGEIVFLLALPAGLVCLREGRHR